MLANGCVGLKMTHSLVRHMGMGKLNKPLPVEHKDYINQSTENTDPELNKLL